MRKNIGIIISPIRGVAPIFLSVSSTNNNSVNKLFRNIKATNNLLQTNAMKRGYVHPTRILQYLECLQTSGCDMQKFRQYLENGMPANNAMMKAAGIMLTLGSNHYRNRSRYRYSYCVCTMCKRPF